MIPANTDRDINGERKLSRKVRKTTIIRTVISPINIESKKDGFLLEPRKKSGSPKQVRMSCSDE